MASTAQTRDPALPRIAAGLTIAALLVAWGVAWATATTAAAQKVGRGEFSQHVAESDRRFQADSFDRLSQSATLRRIETKMDSTNDRLSRLICERGPSYCR